MIVAMSFVFRTNLGEEMVGAAVSLGLMTCVEKGIQKDYFYILRERERKRENTCEVFEPKELLRLYVFSFFFSFFSFLLSTREGSSSIMDARIFRDLLALFPSFSAFVLFPVLSLMKLDDRFFGDALVDLEVLTSGVTREEEGEDE